MNPGRLLGCARTRERCKAASVASFFGAARRLIVGSVVVLAVLAIAPSGRPSVTSSEIYSVKPDGSDRVDLSNSAGSDSFPSESPRGGRIAFVSDRDGYDAIYVMNDDGSDQRRLAGEITEAHGTICRFSAPVWSPNASTIAFGAACQFLGGDPRNPLRLLDVVSSTGGSVQELDTGGSDPSFSADGRFLAFRQQSNSISATTVGFVALNGGLPVSLGAGYAPSWSPTGHRLAFYSGTRGMAVVNVTRPSHRWTFSTRNAGAPSWSPRGDLIAFYRGGARPGIYVVRPGAHRAARIVDLGEPVAVQWSPNARWLALNGDASAYLVGRNGRLLKRIGGAASAAAWSPNSAHIAWADTSLDGLAVTDPRTQRTLLIGSSTALYGVTWARDSTRVIFSSACGSCAK
jgi:Tol biopolymer transport system component